MKLFNKLQALLKLYTLINDVQKGYQMKNTTKVVGAIFVFLTGLLQVPDIQHAVVNTVNTHPAIAAGVAGLTAILSLIHDPKNSSN